MFYFYGDPEKVGIGFTTNQNDYEACTGHLGLVSHRPLVFNSAARLRAAKQALSTFARNEFSPHRRNPNIPLEQEAAMYWISRTGEIDKTGTKDESILTLGRKFLYPRSQPKPNDGIADDNDGVVAVAMNKQLSKRIPQYLVEGHAMSIAAPELAAEVARRLDEELRLHDMSVSDINRLWEFPRQQIEEAGDEEESESEA
jgi:hypothetical protein